MTDIKSRKDRVQGMLGAAYRWQKVSPKAVVSGSSAQAQNVLTDAIHDIGCLWRSLSEAAAYIERLETENWRFECAYRHSMRCYHGGVGSTDPDAQAEKAIADAKAGRGPVAIPRNEINAKAGIQRIIAAIKG